MSNPNRTPLFANEDDDDSEGYTPFSTKPAKKPVTVNNNLINLSLNTEKEQAVHRVQEQSVSSEKKPVEDKEENEQATSAVGSRRKKVGSSLRKLLKNNRFSRDKFAGAGSVANLQPPTNKLEATPVETSVAETPVAETPPSETTPDIAPVSAQNTVNATPATANMAPVAANVPPTPPRPPRRSRFAGKPTGGGGANVPPVPTAVRAANTMPAASGPVAYNQAPTIDQRNNWGPALITALTERYFRRRADKRIVRKIEKTNDQVKQTQEELLAEKRARRAEKATQVSHTNKRYVAPVPIPPPQTAPAENNMIHTVERFTESISAPQETVTHIADNSETLSKPVKAAEIFAASPLAKEIADREIAQKEIKKQAEHSKSSEQQQWNTLQKSEKLPPEMANEAAFDRRHEVKDSASTRPRVAASAYEANKKARGGGVSVPAISSNAPNVASTADRPQSKTPSSNRTSDVYKQSIQAGFVLGISVIVLGSIAFIILK